MLRTITVPQITLLEVANFFAWCFGQSPSSRNRTLKVIQTLPPLFCFVLRPITVPWNHTFGGRQFFCFVLRKITISRNHTSGGRQFFCFVLRPITVPRDCTFEGYKNFAAIFLLHVADDHRPIEIKKVSQFSPPRHTDNQCPAKHGLN